MKSIRNVAWLVLAGAVVGGCASGKGVSNNAIASNPTPELKSTSMRNSDIKFSLAYMRNANGRMLWDDLGRASYWNQPSRLSPYPIMDLNGQPR